MPVPRRLNVVFVPRLLRFVVTPRPPIEKLVTPREPTLTRRPGSSLIDRLYRQPMIPSQNRLKAHNEKLRQAYVAFAIERLILTFG